MNSRKPSRSDLWMHVNTTSMVVLAIGLGLIVGFASYLLSKP